MNRGILMKPNPKQLPTPGPLGPEIDQLAQLIQNNQRIMNQQKKIIERLHNLKVDGRIHGSGA